MHEVATLLMRSAPGWVEIPTLDVTASYQFRDTTMQIFPDGSWRCQSPQGLTLAIAHGSVNNLEQFLNAFEAANPL